MMRIKASNPWVLVLCLIFAPLLHAQNEQPKVISGSITKKVIPGQSSGTLTVILGNLSVEEDWIVGISAQVGEPITLRGVSVSFTMGKHTRHPSAISSVDTWLEEITPATIRFNRLDSLPGSLALFITVPSGTKLRIEGDSGSLFMGSVPESGGLLIRNGEVLPKQPAGLGHVIAALHAPEQPKELVALPTGEYRVSDSLMQSHLVHFAMPGPSATQGVAHIVIWIDENGAVKKVQRVPGSGVLLDAAEQAVRQWQFRPFVVDGRKVVARGIVTFSFRGSEVFSSLSQDVLPVAGPPISPL